jgi:hypothetical protein
MAKNIKMAELVKELATKAPELVGKAAEILAAMSENATDGINSTKYVLCVECKPVDGSAVHYEPVVTSNDGFMPSVDIEDYGMIAYDSLLEAQRDRGSCFIKNCIEATGRKAYYMPIPQTTYEVLCEKLTELLTGVWEHVTAAETAMNAASAMLGKDIEQIENTLAVVTKLFEGVTTAGVGVLEDGEIVEAVEYEQPCYDEDCDYCCDCDGDCDYCCDCDGDCDCCCDC